MKDVILLFGLLVYLVAANAQTYTDKPYVQDFADKFELSSETADNILIQVRTDRNQQIEISSTNGLLQPWKEKLVDCQFYRPITDMNIISVETHNNQFVYLTDSAVLSNANAGKLYFKHGLKKPKVFVVAHNYTTLIAGDNELTLFQNGEKVWDKSIEGLTPLDIIFDKPGKRFLVLSDKDVFQLHCPDKVLTTDFSGSGLTSFALHNGQLVVGTDDGLIYLDRKSLSRIKTDKKLPCTQITSIEDIDGSLWIGSASGAFKLRDDNKYDYYASKRWLVDDCVVDIVKGPESSVLVLTTKGLNRINFKKMTLADKAEYFQKIQRLRHVRYGFTADLSLRVPGDVSTGFYHDTDNDGLWTSLYLAGELFRYAVTKSEDAKQNAYEAFEAMKRLVDMPNLDGFPARSYERDGYELGLGSNGFSEEWRKEYVKKNGRIWRLSNDGNWRWKSSTSSDESCGHFFVFALFAELAPDKEWRDKAVDLIRQEMDHIMNNDWYLVDWNGKPTAWGRWNPKYVNSFPENVGDRRLNSTLILAFLQTAYHFTADEKYKKAANKLIKKYGYDDNANRPASVIGRVEGQPLSDGWNHSDDQMYFLTVPAFVNYSFTDKQKEKHFAAAQSHWKMELSEKNPIWNFFYAMIGGTDYDLDGSVWWLQNFPMDLVKWSVTNKDRKDLTRIEPNFRNQQYTEVLPPDEQPLHSHNGAYRNDGRGNGNSEQAPYVFLMPYWMGRYVNAISAPMENY